MPELKTFDVPKERGSIKFSVVLRDLGERSTGCRYVTHMRDDEFHKANPGKGYFWRHYFDDARSAELDFAERCAFYPQGELVKPL